MKPLQLTMSAFGPFAEEERLDFGEVAGRELLLIHGPTGAGKTTVLDAMCFALFGDTSGAERSARQMRCSHAAPETITKVAYDFGLGRRKYRVVRQPEQARPKVRGEGVTTEPHKAQLWDRTEAKDDAEGEVVATGARKVTEEVESLFGFELNQFRQIVMLPQGQFRRFLTAESRDKEEILEKLFQTHLYAQVSAKLGDRANTLAAELKETESLMRLILEAAEVPSEQAIEEQSKSLRAQLEIAHRETPNAKQRAEKLRAAVQDAKDAIAKLDELDAAKDAHAKLKTRKPAIQKLTAELEKAKKAGPLVTIEKNWRQRSEEVERLTSELETAVREERAADDTKSAAVRASVEAKKHSSERRTLVERLAKLDEIRQEAARIDEAKKQLAVTTERGRQVRVDHDTATRALAEVQGRLERNQKELEASQREAGQLGKHELGLAYSEALRDKRRRLEGLSEERRGAEQDLAALEQSLAEAERLTEARAAHREVLESRWRHGQAGVLARALSEGEPCSVCGATEHPTPASADADVPTMDALETAKRDQSEAESGRNVLRREVEKARAAVLRVAEAEQLLGSDVGEAKARTTEELEARVITERSALESAKRSDARARALESDRKDLRVEIEAAETRRDLTSRLLNEARQDFKSARATLEERERDVPDELRTTEAIESEKERCAAELSAIEEAIANTTRELERSTEAHAAAIAKMKTLDAALENTRRISTAAQAELDSARTDAGFESPEAFAEALERVAEIDDIDAEIQEFERAMRSAKDRAGRAEKAARALARPDLDALEHTRAQADEAYERAQRKEQDLERDLEALESARTRYETARAKAQALENEHGSIAQVAQAARGLPPYNISFQRFVLGALLDDVLAAASERLHRMSKGRYRLERTDEVKHRGRAAGLELVVDDAYTGTARPVETLSGGESFWAALSLSLGLADVAQAYSGGLRLDAMFIDEGFGTLDPDSLELALDTLTALNAGGRLVGIISHVPELRERIPTRLEVIPTEKGSQTRFILG